MIARMGSGWQVVLADLSMILFMVTAAAVADAPLDPAPAIPAVPALGDPVAVWRGGGEGLAAWLAAQPADPRLRLTIVAPQAAAGTAVALAASAGRPARIVLEPDGAGAPYAALAFDQGGALARPLQASGAKETTP